MCAGAHPSIDPRPPVCRWHSETHSPSYILWHTNWAPPSTNFRGGRILKIPPSRPIAGRWSRSTSRGKVSLTCFAKNLGRFLSLSLSLVSEHRSRPRGPWCSSPVFKIEVFSALQTRIGSSKYTSLKTTLQNATSNWKWRRHLKSSISFAHHKNRYAYGIVTTRSGVRWWIIDSSHCIGNMFYRIQAHVSYEFCMSFLYS